MIMFVSRIDHTPVMPHFWLNKEDLAMSRIPALDLAQVDPKAKPLLDAVEKGVGMTPNLYKVAAQSPAALEGLLGLSGALAKGRFNARLREAIALAVAEVNGCDYCLSAHTAIGKSVGLSDSDIGAARHGHAGNPKDAAIIGFARTVVQNRGPISDTDLAQLRKVGINDGEIVEAIAHVVVNIFTNYLNHVAGTDIDFPIIRAHVVAAA
jgi:uncharacterized peroxidase-related enzyme